MHALRSLAHFSPMISARSRCVPPTRRRTSKRPPSPAAYVAPPPEQKLASPKQHLAPRRKNPRNAVCEFSVSSYGGYSALASASSKLPEAHSASAWPPQHVSALASIALRTSAAATQRVYCYAVATQLVFKRILGCCAQPRRILVLHLRRAPSHQSAKSRKCNGSKHS